MIQMNVIAIPVPIPLINPQMTNATPITQSIELTSQT